MKTSKLCALCGCELAYGLCSRKRCITTVSLGEALETNPRLRTLRKREARAWGRAKPYQERLGSIGRCGRLSLSAAVDASREIERAEQALQDAYKARFEAWELRVLEVAA